MDDVTFEFNDIISLYTKNDSERGWFIVSLIIGYFIFYIVFILLLIIIDTIAG